MLQASSATMFLRVEQRIRNAQGRPSVRVRLSAPNLSKHGGFAGFFFFRNAFQNSIRNKKSHSN